MDDAASVTLVMRRFYNLEDEDNMDDQDTELNEQLVNLNAGDELVLTVSSEVNSRVSTSNKRRRRR